MASGEDERALITELLSATNTIDLIEQRIVERVSARMAELRTTEKYRDLPEKFFTETEKETIRIIRATMGDEDIVSSRFAPIYMKHFTAEELEDLIEFYRSPLGKKVLSVMPTIQSEFEAVSESVERDVIVPKVVKIVQSKLEKYGNRRSAEEL